MHNTGDLNINNTQKEFKYYCYQSLLMLTTLLLSMEQFLNNENNPNVAKFKKEDKKQGNTGNREMEDLFQYFAFWLQSQVFLQQHIPEKIRITFLQILCMTVNEKKFDYEDRLVEVINDYLERAKQKNHK